MVDGNNVVGARPDGWWRDRRRASRRLLARLQCYRRHTGQEIVLFFDVPQPDLPEGEHDGVIVRYPARRAGTPPTSASSSSSTRTRTSPSRS